MLMFQNFQANQIYKLWWWLFRYEDSNILQICTVFSCSRFDDDDVFCL